MRASRNQSSKSSIGISPARFIATVWPSGGGFGFVAAKSGSSWRDVAIDLGEDVELEVAAFLRRHRATHDCYFCPTPFSHPKRRKANALPTRWLHCDVDGGDVDALTPPPSALWETSPGRTQALWRLDERVSVEDAEAFNRAFAEVGDNCWDVTHVLRIPGTTNFKPAYDRPRVRIVHLDWTPLTARPKRVERADEHRGARGHAQAAAGGVLDGDLRALWRKYPRLSLSIRRLMRKATGDRSATCFLIMCESFRQGLTREEVSAVVVRSAAYQDRLADGRRPDIARELNNAERATR